MSTKKKTSKASTEKKVQKPTLKRTLTSEIIAELSSRGIRAEIDYKAVLSRVREKVNFVLIDLQYNVEVEESNDEQWFDEVADLFPAILERIDEALDDVNSDYKEVLQDVESRLDEVKELAECNAICECEDECDREEMNDIASRIGDILFYASRYESIAKYLIIEKIAGKVYR